MKYFVFCILIFSQHVIWANHFPKNDSKDFRYIEKLSKNMGISKDCCKLRPYASSNFFITDPSLLYNITLSNFPQTVLLSQHRSGGFKKGDIQLTDTGVKINASGTYSISFAANLLNPGSTSAQILISLSENGVFTPSANTIGCIVQLPRGLATIVQRTGILKNVKKGTTLSIIASIVDGSEPQTIAVGWNISLFRLHH